MPSIKGFSDTTLVMIPIDSGYPQGTVLIFLTIMATYGVYNGDIELIAPLLSVLGTGGICFLCWIINPQEEPILPK